MHLELYILSQKSTRLKLTKVALLHYQLYKSFFEAKKKSRNPRRFRMNAASFIYIICYHEPKFSWELCVKPVHLTEY